MSSAISVCSGPPRFFGSGPDNEGKRVGAVRARLVRVGGFAAKKPLTVCVFDF